MSTGVWDDTPCISLEQPGDDLQRILSAATTLLLKHPTMTQDAFAALVAEGRRFGQTDAGRRWMAALADSELVRNGRALWEGSALNLLEDAPGTVIPSAVLDAIVQVLGRPDLRERLPQLLHD